MVCSAQGVVWGDGAEMTSRAVRGYAMCCPGPRERGACKEGGYKEIWLGCGTIKGSW